MKSREIYLDYAAATPLDKRVFLAMEPYLSEQFYNPSAAYTPARKVREAYDDAKHRLAMAVGGKRDEIVMTAGATESINIAFRGVLEPGDHVVIGATEHPAVYAVAEQYDCTVAGATEKGIVTAEAVKKCITDRTKLVSVTAADSELGVIQPLRDIASVIHEVRQQRQERGIATPLYFHTDASQAAGAVDLHVARLGVDMMTLNAAKCYGPKQVGLLWTAASIAITPTVFGGGQERGLRSGTENVAGTIGFASVLEYAQNHRHSEGKRLAGLRDELQAKLVAALPELVVNGHPKKRLPGHLHVSLDGLDAERVVFHLDMKGVCCATGAACAANKGTRSRALVAVGMSDSLADGSLRFSLGRGTTEEDIEQAAELIIEAIKTERTL